MTWGVRSLQAVWWTTQPIQADLTALYQTMVGAAAGSTQSTPATSMFVVNGQNAGMQYRIQRQANRLDFFANPDPSQGTRPPTISDIPDAIKKFQGRLDAASSAITATNRLAIVVTVSKMVESTNTANQQIAELTGIALPFHDLSDVLFQINRRKHLPAVPNLQVNRVLKWLVETFQFVEIASGVVSTQNFNAATVNVDINTVPAPGRLFDASEQITIFGAMATEAERLCCARSINALSE